MPLRNSADAYGAISKLLHWLTVGLVLFAWVLGLLNDEFPKGAARNTALFAHISAGLCIVMLAVIRLMTRASASPGSRGLFAISVTSATRVGY